MKTYLHMNPKWLRTAIGIIVLLFTTAVCNVRAESVTRIDTKCSDTSVIERPASDVKVNADSTSVEFSNVRHKNTFGTIKALTKKIVNHKNDIVFIVVALLIVIVLLYLASAWVFFLFKKTHPHKEDCLNWGMRAFLLLMIIEICVFSNSSWAYLALVALCVLLLDKYIPGLLTDFSKAAAAIQGKLSITSPTQQEMSDKRKSEVIENSVNVNQQAHSKPVGVMGRNINRQEIHLINRQVAEYTAVEQLAINHLQQEYPNFQGPIKLRMDANQRVVLDGLIQNEDKNIVVEIKYCQNENLNTRKLKPLFEVTDYITKKTGISTMLLLFIVVDQEPLKHKLEAKYQEQLFDGMNLQVQVYTREELN